VNHNLKSEIIEIISNLTQTDKENIDSKVSFADSGIDSFRVVEIVYAIENKYEIDIPQSDLLKVQCIDGLAELVGQLLNSNE